MFANGLFVIFLGLPLGILGWFLYATLLGTRIAIIFKKDVQLESEISDLRLTIRLVGGSIGESQYEL